jgi:NTP pyrophosphatase (non-canonical NTP hydrolase)
MSEIKELTNEIVVWADEVFPDRDETSALLKLFEEVGELVRDPSQPGEYADICIMIFDLAHMHDIDLSAAIREKIEINKRRSWTKTATGTLQHTGIYTNRFETPEPESEATLVWVLLCVSAIITLSAYLVTR